MVRFTVDILQGAAQYINPIKERELDLRGYRATEIENLGATLDQFDTIDFSDNEIRKLEGFPFLKRLKCLLLNNNRISRIGENLEEQLPALDSIILTGNNIQNLGDLDVLSTIKTLRHLSVLKNPVALRKHYRLYIIFKVPQLRILDFKRIKLAEREEAKKTFKGKKGETLAKEIGIKSAPEKSNTFVPGEPIEREETTNSAVDQLAIKEAISKATTLEEVERLSQLLKGGQIPKEFLTSHRPSNGGDKEEEEEEEQQPGMDTGMET